MRQVSKKDQSWLNRWAKRIISAASNTPALTDDERSVAKKIMRRQPLVKKEK